MLVVCWLVLRHVSAWLNRPFSGSLLWLRGRDSSVGIATRYGLEGPRIECLWGRDFPHPSRPTLGPTQPPIKWVPGLLHGSKAARGWRWPPIPSSDEVKERVDIYLYYHSGPSWPLLRWTLLSTLPSVTYAVCVVTYLLEFLHMISLHVIEDSLKMSYQVKSKHVGELTNKQIVWFKELVLNFCECNIYIVARKMYNVKFNLIHV